MGMLMIWDYDCLVTSTVALTGERIWKLPVHLWDTSRTVHWPCFVTRQWHTSNTVIKLWNTDHSETSVHVIYVDYFNCITGFGDLIFLSRSFLPRLFRSTCGQRSEVGQTLAGQAQHSQFAYIRRRTLSCSSRNQSAYFVVFCQLTLVIYSNLWHMVKSGDYYKQEFIMLLRMWLICYECCYIDCAEKVMINLYSVRKINTAYRYRVSKKIIIIKIIGLYIYMYIFILFFMKINYAFFFKIMLTLHMFGKFK